MLLKKHVQKLNYDSRIKEVELIEANPQYAHIRHSNGMETTVPIHHLAPMGDENNIGELNTIPGNIPKPTTAEHNIANDLHESISKPFDSTVDNLQNEELHDIPLTPPNSSPNESDHNPTLSCSKGTRQAPARLGL